MTSVRASTLAVPLALALLVAICRAGGVHGLQVRDNLGGDWRSAQLPPISQLRVVHRYAHSTDSFTEGLTIHHERHERADRNANATVHLYESTGLWGRSSLKLWKCDTDPAWNAVALDTNSDPLLASVHPPLRRVHSMSLPATTFAEGITVLNGQLYVLTYQSPHVYVVDLKLPHSDGSIDADDTDAVNAINPSDDADAADAAAAAGQWTLVDTLSLPASVLGLGGWGITSADRDGSDRLTAAQRAHRAQRRKQRRATTPSSSSDSSGSGGGSVRVTATDDVLIVSDGSDRLHVLTPHDLGFVQTVRVAFADQMTTHGRNAAAARGRRRPNAAPKTAAADDEFAHLNALSFSSVNAHSTNVLGGDGGAGGGAAAGHNSDAPFELNELEFVDGQIWANAYGTDCILRIDLVPAAVNHTHTQNDGAASASTAEAGVVYAPIARVVGVLVAPPTFYTGPYKAVHVMNGIAYDTLAHRLFVTGKFWPFVYEAEPVPHPDFPAAHGDLDLGAEALTTELFAKVCPRHPLSIDDVLYSTQLLADPQTNAASTQSSSSHNQHPSDGLVSEFGLPHDYPSLGKVLNSFQDMEQRLRESPEARDHARRYAHDGTTNNNGDDVEPPAEWSQAETDATQLLYMKMAPQAHAVRFHAKPAPKPKPKPQAKAKPQTPNSKPAAAAAATASALASTKAAVPAGAATASALQPLAHPAVQPRHANGGHARLRVHRPRRT